MTMWGAAGLRPPCFKLSANVGSWALRVIYDLSAIWSLAREQQTSIRTSAGWPGGD